MRSTGYWRDFLFQDQRGFCKYCARQMTMDIEDEHLVCTIDHVKPRAEGGHTLVENIVGACRQCNNGRGVIPYEIFARYVRRFGPPKYDLSHKSNWGLRRARDHMRENRMPEPLINDVLKQKLEAAIRAKIAALDMEITA